MALLKRPCIRYWLSLRYAEVPVLQPTIELRKPGFPSHVPHMGLGFQGASTISRSLSELSQEGTVISVCVQPQIPLPQILLVCTQRPLARLPH